MNFCSGPHRSALRNCEIFCASVASSTKVSGQSLVKNSSFSIKCPWLSTSSNKVSKTLGFNGTGLPARSNCWSEPKRRNLPNSYVTWRRVDMPAFRRVRTIVSGDAEQERKSAGTSRWLESFDQETFNS